MAADPGDIQRYSWHDISAWAAAIWAGMMFLAGSLIKGWQIRRRLRREDSEDAEKRVKAAVARVQAEMAEKAALNATIEGLRADMRAFSDETRFELAAIRTSQAAHDETLKLARQNEDDIRDLRERTARLEDRAGVAIAPKRRRGER